MKLTEDQIEEIDKYLQILGVKFIDVRIELIDHLATEFENESEYVLIGDFLRTKGNFVKKFQKQWDKTRHWSHQKALLLRVLSYFASIKNIPITLGVALFIYLATSFTGEFMSKILLLISLSIPQIMHLYLFYKPKGMHKKILSAKYMGSIMALPLIFLYSIGLVTPTLKENLLWFALYWFAAVIFNIAGVQEVIVCKRKILKNYSELLKTA
jgi:hypothetical protein